MKPRRHIHQEETRSPDAGDTLVELLVALAIISICVVGLIGGLTSAIASSGNHRNLTQLDSAIKGFAELVRYDVQLQPNSPASTPPTAPLFARCATSYLLAGTPNPSSGPVGTAVTAFGSGFSGAGSSVTLGATTFNNAVTQTGNGNVRANFTVPALPAGTYPITINGGGTATSTIGYTVTPWLGALSVQRTDQHTRHGARHRIRGQQVPDRQSRLVVSGGGRINEQHGESGTPREAPVSNNPTGPDRRHLSGHHLRRDQQRQNHVYCWGHGGQTAGCERHRQYVSAGQLHRGHQLHQLLGRQLLHGYLRSVSRPEQPQQRPPADRHQRDGPGRLRPAQHGRVEPAVRADSDRHRGAGRQLQPDGRRRAHFRRRGPGTHRRFGPRRREPDRQLADRRDRDSAGTDVCRPESDKQQSGPDAALARNRPCHHGAMRRVWP